VKAHSAFSRSNLKSNLTLLRRLAVQFVLSATKRRVIFDLKSEPGGSGSIEKKAALNSTQDRFFE
jgi:hypothetical protein